VSITKGMGLSGAKLGVLRGCRDAPLHIFEYKPTCATCSSNSSGSCPLSFTIFFRAVNDIVSQLDRATKYWGTADIREQRSVRRLCLDCY
jgi:hypothetical protein